MVIAPRRNLLVKDIYLMLVETYLIVLVVMICSDKQVNVLHEYKMEVNCVLFFRFNFCF